MKRLVMSTLVAAQLVTVAHAGMHKQEIKKAQVEMEEALPQTPYYVVLKGLYVLGDDMRKEEAFFDGDNGGGFGVDFGYRFGNGLALELDYAYATNTVDRTETTKETVVRPSVDECGLPITTTTLIEKTKKDAIDTDYHSLALDLVYTYEATEQLGIFGKVGYEYEWAKGDETEHDSGLALGVGLEYKIDERYRFVTEYEHTTIDGTKGDGIFAGVMINF